MKMGAVLRAQHTHKMLNILFKNFIGMKIHIWMRNNSILLEVLASVFAVSSNFPDNPVYVVF